MTNQGKLFKTLTYLRLSFVKRLPRLVIENHGSKFSYCNTLCKNISPNPNLICTLISNPKTEVQHQALMT